MNGCSMPGKVGAGFARSAGVPIAAGLALLLLAGGGVAALETWPTQAAGLSSWAAHAMDRMGITGWFVAASIQILIALCGILPASMGAFAAGMAYGIAGGFVLCGAATLTGALLAFSLTRSLFRPFISRTMSKRPRVSRLDEYVARDGWRLVALMRLSPIMPFAATSYALGLTSLSSRQYLIGTLASLPALLGYVTMGHLAKTGVSLLLRGRTDPLHWAALALAVAATVLLTIRLARIVRFALQLPDPSLPPVQVETCVSPR